MPQESNSNFTEVTVNGLPLPSRTTRKNIVTVTIVACWVLIGYLIVFGSAQNSLHQSALSWGFTLMGATIFAYVFGAVLDNFNFWKSAKAQENKTS